MIAKLIGPVAFALTQSGFLLPATLAVSMPKIIAAAAAPAPAASVLCCSSRDGRSSGWTSIWRFASIAQELSGYLPAMAAASSRASWKRFRLASALTTIQARSAASGLSGARLFACRASSIARRGSLLSSSRSVSIATRSSPAAGVRRSRRRRGATAGAFAPDSFVGGNGGAGRRRARPPPPGRPRLGIHFVRGLGGRAQQEVSDRRDHHDEREHLRTDPHHDARCAFYFRFGTSSRVIVYVLA